MLLVCIDHIIPFISSLDIINLSSVSKSFKYLRNDRMIWLIKCKHEISKSVDVYNGSFYELYFVCPKTGEKYEKIKDQKDIFLNDMKRIIRYVTINKLNLKEAIKIRYYSLKQEIHKSNKIKGNSLMLLSDCDDYYEYEFGNLEDARRDSEQAFADINKSNEIISNCEIKRILLSKYICSL